MILGEFEQAQAELVGKAVILTDGKAGRVESIWLDEMHGFESLSEATMGNGLSPSLNSRSRAETALASTRIGVSMGHPTTRVPLISLAVCFAPRRFAPPGCFGERINRLFASTMKWRWQRP
jgi:hypothetical protein